MSDLVVTADAPDAPDGPVTKGWATLDTRRYRCALGRGGIIAEKREGDGGTPVGRFPLRQLYSRADKGVSPVTTLPVRALSRADGWCDAPDDRNYNRPVRHPYPASAERLWRGDHLYDVVVVLEKAIPLALKKAKPGTPEFRTALRDAFEAMGSTTVAHGTINWTKDDHWGYTLDTGVIYKVSNGAWKVE